MKIGKVVSFRSFNLNFFRKCDRVVLLLYSLSAFGLITGFLLFSKENNTSAIAGLIFERVLLLKIEKDILKSFFITLICLFTPVVLLIIFGSSLFGIVIVPLVVLIINGFFGILLAFSYHNYQMGGLAFNSVLLIPSFFVFLIGLMISASAILRFSLYQLSTLKKGKALRLSAEFSSMLKKQIFVILLFIPDVIFDLLLNRLFIKSFNFI